MEILIYEDDKKEVTSLSKNIDIFFKKKDIKYNITISEKYTDFIDRSYFYDLIFLDIEVKNENGINVGIDIRKKNKKAIIIFITNYSKYLIDGYKACANRYFLKPINQIEFEIEMESIIVGYLEEFDGFYDFKISNKKIYYKDIRYVQFSNRKSMLHFISGEIYDTYYTLKHWSNILSNNFVQPYKSYLVNLQYVNSILKEDIVLDNKEKIPVSRLFKSEFKSEYLKYLKEHI